MTETKRRVAAARGLSLVELLIVIVIVGILVTIAYPRIRAARGGGRAGVPAQLEWVTLPDASARVGSAAQVAVRAKDASGYPVRGVVVELEGDAGTGQVLRNSATTDGNGVARVSWRFATDSAVAGGAAARVLVSARVRGHPEVSVRATTPLPAGGR